MKAYRFIAPTNNIIPYFEQNFYNYTVGWPMRDLRDINFELPYKTVFLDVGEVVRFGVTGVVATAGNLSMVWLTQSALGLSAALVVGICTGLGISFILSKLYAFRSHSWDEAHFETMRFLIVYTFGAVINWTIGYSAGQYLLPAFMPTKVAGIIAALLGAGSMAFTSYFGHRFFTYKTGHNPAGDLWPSFRNHLSRTTQKMRHDADQTRFVTSVLSIICFCFLMERGSTQVASLKRMPNLVLDWAKSGHFHFDVPVAWIVYPRTVISLDYIRSGFVRRGLGGTLAYMASNDFIDGAILFSMLSLVLFCMAATLIVLRIGLRKSLIAAVYMALVIGLSQQTFGLWGAELARTDLLVAACLAWAAFTTIVGYRAVGAMIIMAGYLVHETAVIFGGPLLLAINASDVARSRLKHRSAVTLGLGAVSALACLVVVQSMLSPSIAAIRDAMLRFSPPNLTDPDTVLRDIAIYMATSGTRGLGDALCFNFSFNRQYIPMAISGILVLLAYVLICFLRFRIWAVLIAVLAPYLFLSVIAMDVGRWVSLGVCTAWLLGCSFLSSEDTKAPRPLSMTVGAACFAVLLAMGPTTFKNVNTATHDGLIFLGFADPGSYKDWLGHCDPTWRDRVYNRITETP